MSIEQPRVKSSEPVERPTRERILAVAARLFHETGYAATGVASILREADVRSGSLYHFFPTKEDLLLAVLERYEALLWPEVMQPVFERLDDPIERIFGVLDGYRQMLTITSCGLGCPVGNLALELSDTHPAARERIAGLFNAWSAVIRQCLDDASDKLPPSVARDDLASFVLTVMEGGVMQSKTHRSLEPFDAAVTQLRDYFDRLVADGTSWSAPKGKQERRP